jgi:hypothetical protein
MNTDEIIDNSVENGTINSRGDGINNPIEQAHPADVIWGKVLNKRQRGILDRLPSFGDRLIVRKSDVSMLDLAAMTANIGVEFAMFTRKDERLIVRGDEQQVPLYDGDLKKLLDDGYRWSGHTHIGSRDVDLIPSDGDKKALTTMKQSNSVIFNAAGKHRLIYPKDGESHD